MVYAPCFRTSGYIQANYRFCKVPLINDAGGGTGYHFGGPLDILLLQRGP